MMNCQNLTIKMIKIRKLVRIFQIQTANAFCSRLCPCPGSLREAASESLKVVKKRQTEGGERTTGGVSLNPILSPPLCAAVAKRIFASVAVSRARVARYALKAGQ